MDSAVHRSLRLRPKLQALDLLASWQLRHGISCALSGIAVLMVWSMMPHGTKAAAVTRTPAPARPDSGVVAQHVANLHIFGGSVTEAATAPVAPVADIKVQGLIYSDDKGSALAILEVSGKSDFFKVGDTLPDGEKLAAIAPTAIQLTQGITQRIVEMPTQSDGPGDGIALAGNTGLTSGGSQFPGFALPSDAQTYKPALRTVDIPQGANPLDQLRSLRQQLIPQQAESASSAAAKQPAKP